MGISFLEDAITTGAKVQGVIKQAIHASSDWTHVPVAASTSVATAPVAAGAQSCTVASATGIVVGGCLTFWRAAAINGAATPECRIVTAVNGTTISWADPLTCPQGTYQVGDAIGVGMTVTATTTRGAVMVVDLADAAITAGRMQVGVYNGLSGSTPQNKYTGGGPHVTWKQVLGAATDVVRATVSAGKEHLFVAIEGPRASETNADSTSLGSTKQCFVLCDVNPYYPGQDLAPAFCLIRNSGTSYACNNQNIVVSKDYTGQANWPTGWLESVDRISDNAGSATTFNARGLDGSLVLKPWVVMEDAAGWRGTLTRFFWGGRASVLAAADPIPTVAVGMTETYGGVNYKCIAPQRGVGTQVNRTSIIGDFNNYSATPFAGPLLFVPVP
ncbi:MAG TPA: hypothetical protein VFP72_12830 [Kineosporiaceae bacterium]|nr:hypothetical protein [Kineosporiaceae bacterium]